MAEPNVEDVFIEETPIVFVISDARGKTAAGVVEAAAAQFEEGVISIKQLGNVRSIDNKNVHFFLPLATHGHTFFKITERASILTTDT